MCVCVFVRKRDLQEAERKLEQYLKHRQLHGDVIKNEEGKDVSSFYSFDIEDFKVKLLPRNVSYLPLIESKTYDGEEIIYEGKIKQEIKLYDDIISFDVYYTDLEGNILSSTPKNAGEYYINVDIDSFKAMNNGVNVTNKYNIINFVDIKDYSKDLFFKVIN